MSSPTTTGRRGRSRWGAACWLLVGILGCASEARPSLTGVACNAALGACEASDGALGAPDAAGSAPVPAPTAGSTGEGSPSDLAGVGGVTGAGNVAASGARDAGATPLDAAVVVPDRCDVGVLDPSRPPASLELSGDLGAHDPVIVAAGGRYHYFSTGDGISVKTSPDLLRWTQGPDVFPTTPAWFTERVPAYAPRNVWAPDVAYFGGQYHLYYSVSSFGSNRSCIGHATRASLDSGAWEDHEAVFCSNQPGETVDYNAIDPNVILDEAGTPWMSFGSFWSGIYLIELSLAGEHVGSAAQPIASRGGGSIEAPFIVRRCGFHYLFVSFGACCQGVDSTYEIRVGRSVELRGPYVDRDGRPMLDGGGTLLLERGGDWVGPGHNAVLIEGTRAYNVYHAYAASNGAAQLRIAELVWDGEGWPVSGGP